MQEFIEKLIGRLEKDNRIGRNSLFAFIEIINQLAEEYAECYKDCEQCEAYDKEKHYCPKWCNVIKNTAKEMVENELGVILIQLLEAKKNCGEDSDCSECPFGQIEDRCILAELQMEHNGGWIPCSERLPEDGVKVLVWFEYFRYGDYNRLFQTKGISFTYNGDWSGFVNDTSGWSQLRVIAWQPLPPDYQPKGE